jgi:hypothetical protein
MANLPIQGGTPPSVFQDHPAPNTIGQVVTNPRLGLPQPEDKEGGTIVRHPSHLPAKNDSRLVGFCAVKTGRTFSNIVKALLRGFGEP